MYSEDAQAADKLHEEYGVYVAKNYDDFVAPVFILNAIDRSLKSLKEETVNRF